MKSLTWRSLICLILFSSTAQAQFALNVGESQLSLNANGTAAPQTGTAFGLPVQANVLTWVTSYASAPASVSVQLELSNDNVTYVTADNSTNVNGESRTIFTAARFVRVTESARSGGGAITVSLICKTGPIATVGTSGNFSPSGVILAQDGTQPAPSYTFNTDPTTGFFLAAPAIIQWATNGTNRGRLSNSEIRMTSAINIAWAPSTNINTSADTTLGRAGAGELLIPSVAFASLGTPSDGAITRCSDCAPTTPGTCPGTKASCVCTSGGTGSLAVRTNSIWYCPF